MTICTECGQPFCPEDEEDDVCQECQEEEAAEYPY